MRRRSDLSAARRAKRRRPVGLGRFIGQLLDSTVCCRGISPSRRAPASHCRTAADDMAHWGVGAQICLLGEWTSTAWRDHVNVQQAEAAAMCGASYNATTRGKNRYTICSPHISSHTDDEAHPIFPALGFDKVFALLRPILSKQRKAFITIKDRCNWKVLFEPFSASLIFLNVVYDSEKRNIKENNN
eukprot:Selendium_serpulae@DN6198_c1_g1_i2.p1